MRLNSLPPHVDIVRINSRTFQDEIHNRIKKYVDLDKNHKYFRPLSPADVQQLKGTSQMGGFNMQFASNDRYLLTYNTGKNNFWLYLTQDRGRQFGLIFDKNRSQFYQIKTPFPENCHKGTLFEVQLFQVESPIDCGDGNCSNGNNSNRNCSNGNYTNRNYSNRNYSNKNYSNVNYANADYTNTVLSAKYNAGQPGATIKHVLILISDIMLHQQKLVTDRLNDRSNLIIEIFKQMNHQSSQIFEFSFKPMFTYSQLESAWYELRPELNYNASITGILFCPIDPSPVSHTSAVNLNQKHLKKTHPPTHFWLDVDKSLKKQPRKIVLTKTDEPINFIVRKTGQVDVYHLYLNDVYGNQNYVDVALVNDIGTSRKLFNLLNTRSELVLSCQYDPRFQKWKPMEVGVGGVMPPHYTSPTKQCH